MEPMSVTRETSHLESSPLNDEAEANMSRMSVTLVTSHLEMSPLNVDAGANKPAVLVTMNNWLMSLIANTSHDPIGPCGPFKQSLHSFRHNLMWAWSSGFDSGAHPAVIHIYASDAVEAVTGPLILTLTPKGFVHFDR